MKGGCPAVGVQVREAMSSAETGQFLRLPWRLYAGDPLWVPPLMFFERRLLDTKRSVFFQKTEAALYMAWRGRRAVGRIAAIVHRPSVEYRKEATGFWGFFECEDDPEAAVALFDAAGGFLSSRGMRVMRGPFNPTINRSCGLLVEGFDSAPSLMMPYNPPCYPDLVRGAGLQTCRELLAYSLSVEDAETHAGIIRRVKRLAGAAAEFTPGLSVETLDMADYEKGAALFISIFSRAREGNWGYVPPSGDEVRAMAAEMKWIVEPTLLVIAKIDGIPAGCALALPDCNPILRGMNGRILPFGWWKFLSGRKKLRGLRGIGIACLPEYRNHGVVAVLLARILENALKLGFREVESSWIDSDNINALQLSRDALWSHPVKRYEIFEKPLPSAPVGGRVPEGQS